MKINIFLSLAFFVVALFNIHATAEPPQFKIKKIDNYRCECCGIGDFNKDGKIDIISGENIYFAPDWKKIKFREIKSDINSNGDGYAWDFMDAPIDVDGDGLLDVVTLSWHGKCIEWLKNPGIDKIDSLWEKFLVDKNGNFESGDLFDVNGDGKKNEIVPHAQTTFWLNVEKKPDGTQGLVKHIVSTEKSHYGAGVGDINGDGKPDFIRPTAWFEAPQKPNDEWIKHPLSLGSPDGQSEHTPQILVYDINGDGRNDIITSSAHRYGI
ncbi:MAG: VCBS repeat-containing protein, partial [Planctomycetaceae bacterium]|nr:VCBS repeat-containing protein [Planctomycetaceae bacterium]